MFRTCDKCGSAEEVGPSTLNCPGCGTVYKTPHEIMALTLRKIVERAADSANALDFLVWAEDIAFRALLRAGEKH